MSCELRPDAEAGLELEPFSGVKRQVTARESLEESIYPETVFFDSRGIHKERLCSRPMARGPYEKGENLPRRTGEKS